AVGQCRAHSVIDDSGSGIGRPRVVTLEYGEIELSVRYQRRILEPEIRAVADVGGKEADRIILRETRVLRVLRQRVDVRAGRSVHADRGRGVVELLSLDIAAEFRIGVVPSDKNFQRKLRLALQLKRVIAARKTRAAVLDEADIHLGSGGRGSLTGGQVSRRHIEVIPCTVNDVRSQDA